MTTKFLDNKIFTFEILLSWRFPRKTAFWTIVLSAPKASPPQKAKILFLLRKSAVSCSFLRFPAVFCEKLRFRNAVIPGKICENQRKTANLAPPEIIDGAKLDV